MEEIKELVEIIAKLPQFALWVLVAFWCYKVICVGTLYGVIRLAIVKTHNWLVTPERKIVQIEDRLKEICVTSADSLLVQITRIRRRPEQMYIRAEDVQWLSIAIDEKLAKDKANNSSSTNATTRI